MKRYCYMKTDGSKFEGKENNGLWEVNYRRLVESVLKNNEEKPDEEYFFNMIKESEIPYQEVYKSSINPKTRTLYKELLYGVLKSAECELDVVNEVYLMSVQARKEKELLFFSENDNELNIKMKDNIKNIKRNPEKQNIIFHIAENLGTGKEQRIDAFGSDVFRLYLWSKDFRNLFVETDKVYDKYSFNEILRILDSGVDKKILTRKPETSIIIEKILGLTGVQCMNCFIGDLLNKVNVINVKEREDGQLEIENTIIDMVKELWNISGEYSRVLMMQLIYWELKYSQTSIGEPGSTGGRIAIGNKENEQRAIALYTKLLKEVKKVFNLYYGKIVKAVWEEYRKVYSPKALAELLKEKREQLFKCDAALTLLDANRVRWHTDKTKMFKKMIEENDSKKIEEFWNAEEVKWKINPFYIEHNNVFEPAYKFSADERFVNLIQQVVIQQNIEKYSE